MSFQEHSTQGDQNQHFSLSRDPRIALEETIRTIEQLHSVYERETDALERSDTKDFLSLQHEKLEVATLYQNSIEEIKSRKEEMGRVGQDLKNKLKHMQRDFSDLAQKNREALSRMQRTVERLGNTIRSAAKDAALKQRATSYGQTGALDKAEKRSISMGVTETV